MFVFLSLWLFLLHWHLYHFSKIWTNMYKLNIIKEIMIRYNNWKVYQMLIYTWVLRARILPVAYLRVLSLLRVMFCLSFSRDRMLSNEGTRSSRSYMFKVLRPICKTFQQSALCYGVKCWKKLPREIRMIRDWKIVLKETQRTSD